MSDIRESRIAAGLSVAELARRSGIAPSNLSAIENGKRAASTEMVARILDATGRPSAVLREKRNEVLEVIARSGCRNPRVFGSVARGEDVVGSDIDIIVQYGRGHAKDLYALPRLLSAILGIPVDVVTEGGLRESDSHILTEALPL